MGNAAMIHESPARGCGTFGTIQGAAESGLNPSTTCAVVSYLLPWPRDQGRAGLITAWRL